MSDQVKLTLGRVAVFVGIMGGLAGLFGAWVIIPYRMEAAETTLRQLQSEARSDHDLLSRIDERTIRIEKALDRQQPR